MSSKVKLYLKHSTRYKLKTSIFKILRKGIYLRRILKIRNLILNKANWKGWLTNQVFAFTNWFFNLIVFLLK